MVDQAACVSRYALFGGNITDRMICAGVDEGEKDSCTVRVESEFATSDSFFT